MASPTLPWIDRALEANGHPTCEAIVRAGRQADPPKSWGELSLEIGTKAGGYVSLSWVRKTFMHLDETAEAVAE